MEELDRIAKRKMRDNLHALEVFLQKFPFRLVHTPAVDLVKSDFHLRDNADYPILLSAIVPDVDILITGDHDFDDVNIERPEILSPYEFLRLYC